MTREEYCGKAREMAYAERVGKVYGDYEVKSIRYDKEKKKQEWTLECQHCGYVKVTMAWQNFVNGKSGRCMRCNSKTRSLMIGQRILCWDVTRDMSYDLGGGEYQHDVEMKCVKCGYVRFGHFGQLYERCPWCGADS